jgi:perosamine synthetase
MGRRYTELLAGHPGLQLTLAETAYAKNIYWVYGIVLDDSLGFDADEAVRRLTKANIGTRPFFWPLHEQPVFREIGLFRDVLCPVASRLARRGFYVPSGLGLAEGDIERVAAVCREVLR